MHLNFTTENCLTSDLVSIKKCSLVLCTAAGSLFKSRPDNASNPSQILLPFAWTQTQNARLETVCKTAV